MRVPLFSTYRAGENRITSSTIAVFERIDLSLVKELLQNAAGMGDELRAVSFENQVAGIGSVPDARISGNFTWLFETKTEVNGYEFEGHDRKQVRAHAQLIDDADTFLFVLTPDSSQPKWFTVLDGVDDAVRDRVIWFSFAGLAAAIESMLGEASRLLSEQTRFLLTELIALFEADGLLSSDDTVIVAARIAWGEYQRYGAYICQPDRTFRRGLTHFGFYKDGAIQPTIARIVKYLPSISFSPSGVSQLRASGEDDAADIVDQILDEDTRDDLANYGLMLLSSRNDAETVSLDAPIINDTVTSTGRPWGWTLGQRYTRLSRLRSGAKRTSEL